MALNHNALVSLAEMKIYLKIPALETSQDSLIESFINEISQLIEVYCNRKFILNTYIERYNGGDRYELLLNNWPIQSITSLHVDHKRLFDSSSLIDPSNYDIFQDEMGDNFILERFDFKFQKGRKNIKVEYEAGYTDITTLPSDIKLACKIAVSYYYQQQQQENWTYSVKSKGDENITLIQGIPESSVIILDNYRRNEMVAPVEPTRNF